jgi:hypothetical protein
LGAISGDNEIMTTKNILMTLLTFVVITAYGQTRTIKGVTLDKGGDPIIGCNVMLKGTTNGTVTDKCGEFQLTTDQKEVTVVFSCLTSDLRAFETIVNTSDFTEGDKVVFHLIGHWKMKNKDCKMTVDKRLKKYRIE